VCAAVSTLKIYPYTHGKYLALALLTLDSENIGTNEKKRTMTIVHRV
jgi:hypothetical protein